MQAIISEIHHMKKRIVEEENKLKSEYKAQDVNVRSACVYIYKAKKLKRQLHKLQIHLLLADHIQTMPLGDGKNLSKEIMKFL